MIVVLILMLQTPLNQDELALYHRILAETSPAAKLALLLDYERRFPKSPNGGVIHEMTMEVYRSRKDFPKTVEYGEKAIKADPENLQALTIVARQYALEGRNFDKAVDYAKRAKDVVARKQSGRRPPGISPADWSDYLRQMASSADWTLNYVRSVTTSLLRRRGRF